MTDPLARAKELLEQDFAGYVAWVWGLGPLPHAKAVKQALAKDAASAPLLHRALRASGVLEGASLEPRPRCAVEDLLRWLGQHRYEPARADFEWLWRNHPQGELRHYGGHALVALGDTAAQEVLASALEEGGGYLFLAVRAAMIVGGYERVAIQFQRSAVVDGCLRVLAEDLDTRQTRVPKQSYMQRDARWLDFAVSLLRNKAHVQIAQWVLSLHPDRALVAAARKRATTKRVTKRVPKAALERATTNMTKLGAQIGALVARLGEIGYQFRWPDQVLVAAPAETASQLADLEARVGPLPASLRAFYSVVGSVDLSGTHPDWARTGHLEMRPGEPWLTDALAIMPLAVLLEDAEDSAPDPLGKEYLPWFAQLSGDDVAKAGYSGGAYGMTLPSAKADAILEREPHNLPLTRYVQLALRWGGFPGFERIDDAPLDWLARLR